MSGQWSEQKTHSKYGLNASKLLLLPQLLWLLLIPPVLGGLDRPVNHQKLLKALYGNPCDCPGGHQFEPGHRSTQAVDCGTKTAYLQLKPSASTGEIKAQWVCKQKPQPLPPDTKGTCPPGCVELTQVHSRCYKTYQQCVKNGQLYLVAKLTNTYKGSMGGEWGPEAFKTPYGAAHCLANIGDIVCWPLKAPLHVSDGGGPTDQEREKEAIRWVEKEINNVAPNWPKHPSLKARVLNEDLDSNIHDILRYTHKLLNQTSPSLAADCWLCMKMSNDWPLAIPVPKPNISNYSNCTYTEPFKVIPQGFNFSTCYVRNHSLTIDIGQVPTVGCSNISEAPSDLGCLPPGQVWVCGGNLAYPALPKNSTGICAPALLLPNIDVLPGTEPVPLPSIDFLGGHRTRRAVVLLPLLAALGVAGGLGMGAAGLGISIDRYNKLSDQLASDIQQVYKSIQDLQDQHDSLARVFLQNQRELDLIVAEKEGLCVALQEKCCFYVNKSGIVRDRARNFIINRYDLCGEKFSLISCFYLVRC